MLFRSFMFAVFACAGVASDRARLHEDIILAEHAGAEPEDVAIQRGQALAMAPDADANDYLRLGLAFVAKGRRTHDDGFFNLAEAATYAAEAKFGLGPELRLLRGHAMHMLHRFAAAEREARILVRERGEAADHGLLSDVLLEQGKMAEAVAALRDMVRLKPGAEAYARIGYMRWLKGDLAGAQAAMAEALRAVPGREREGRAWVLTQLATFELRASEVLAARDCAAKALEAMDDFGPAWFALARAEAAQGNMPEAARALRRAVELNPVPEYQWWLMEVLLAAGDEEGASRVEEALRKRGASADRRTFALFVATVDRNGEEAHRLMQAERLERADVFTQDALAWSLAMRGDLTEAKQAIEGALADGPADARLLFHAGEIAWLGGARAKAAGYFERALQGRATLTLSERAWVERRLAIGPASAAEAGKHR